MLLGSPKNLSESVRTDLQNGADLVLMGSIIYETSTVDIARYSVRK